MKPIVSSIHIDAPPEQVYAEITDLERAPERISGIKKLEVLTEGPFGPGTRFRETRVMFGKEATEEMEVSEVDPGRGYIVEAESCGCRYRSGFTLIPEGGGTDLEFTFHATPTGLMGRVMSAVMMPVMKRSMCKLLRQDMEDIKRSCEASVGAA